MNIIPIKQSKYYRDRYLRKEKIEDKDNYIDEPIKPFDETMQKEVEELLDSFKEPQSFIWKPKPYVLPST